MGRLFVHFLEGRLYKCRQCGTHLASVDSLLSQSFYSRAGKAYLFDQVVNVWQGCPEERQMTTGMHVVCDLYCNTCMQLVGWKYEEAHEKEQRYKEGKSILERIKLVEVYEGSRVSPIITPPNLGMLSVHGSSSEEDEEGY